MRINAMTYYFDLDIRFDAYVTWRIFRLRLIICWLPVRHLKIIKTNKLILTLIKKLNQNFSKRALHGTKHLNEHLKVLNNFFEFFLCDGTIRTNCKY